MSSAEEKPDLLLLFILSHVSTVWRQKLLCAWQNIHVYLHNSVHLYALPRIILSVQVCVQFNVKNVSDFGILTWSCSLIFIFDSLDADDERSLEGKQTDSWNIYDCIVCIHLNTWFLIQENHLDINWREQSPVGFLFYSLKSDDILLMTHCSRLER